MKIIIKLLILSVNIWHVAIAATQANFVEQPLFNRQLQVDRYTGYKANATVEEVNPLLVITQINFPSRVKTVYDAIEHALQRSGYSVDWQQSAEARGIFSELEMPTVHRRLNLMTLKDAISILAGEAWKLLIDSVNRKLIIQLHDYVPWPAASNSGSNDFSSTASPQRRESIVLGENAGVHPNVLDASVPMQNESSNHIQRREAIVVEESARANPNVLDASVPMQNEYSNHIQRREAAALAQATEANLNEANVPVPIHTDLADSQPESSNFFVKQLPASGDIAYHDASMDSFEYNVSPANFIQIKNLMTGNADLYDEHDERSNIHRVQYTPGRVLLSGANSSEQNKQTSSEEHAPKNLWSVQSAIKAKEGVGSLDEAVIVHHSSISVRELIELLIPDGWVVYYEISDAVLNQRLASHAESSRRSALLSLFKELNLKALFYPGQAVVLVAEKEPQSFGSGNSPRFKAIEQQNLSTPVESSASTSKAPKSQPEVDVILENANMIKSLMDEMKPNLK